MQVVKRNGQKQAIDFEKIHWRIKSMCSKPEILEFQEKERPQAHEICRKLPEIKHAEVDLITKKTIDGLYNNIPTTEIDILSAEIAQEMCTTHPDNSVLATRILVSNIHKNTLEILVKTFSHIPRDDIRTNMFRWTMEALYTNRDKKGESSPLIAPYLMAIAYKYSKKIEEMIDYSRDYLNHDYLGIKMLERSYLFRVYEMDNIKENHVIVERPSISDMRIAIGIVCAPTPCPPIYEREDVSEFISKNPQIIKQKYRSKTHLKDLYQSSEPHKHKSVDTKLFKLHYWGTKALELKDIELSDYQWKRIREIYDGMSTGKFTPATPTRFAAGTLRPQGSSCFLIAMEDDSLDGIYNTLHKQSQISKHAGGVGMWVHNIRSAGSYIAGTNGISNGLKPMLKVYDTSSIYVDQGGGKRDGTIACFGKDTEILTINNGVKKIQDVKIGDLVVTHKNRVKPVSQLHINPLGDRKIYKLVVERNKEIYVTGNHRFWSFYTKKYKNKRLSLGWNSIKQLKELMDNKKTTRQACYIGIPSGTGIDDLKSNKIDVLDYKDILEDEDHRLQVLHSKIVRQTMYGGNNHNNSKSINRIWDITEDLVNLFGIWLGDGYIIKDNVKGIIRGIGITVDKSNKEEINFIKRVYKTFGTNVTEDISKTSKCTTIRVNSSMVGMIFHELFGSYFDRKSLPDIIFSWPKVLVESLIGGLITSDGHITKAKCNATLSLSNKTLINQLYHLCRINNIAVSFVKYKRGKGMTCDPYSMSIPLNKNILDQTRKFYTDDRIERCYEKIFVHKNYLKILDIIETDRQDEYVYTLGVEDDHSYTVEGLLAENCYLEPWNADIVDFIRLKRKKGAESDRARRLFYALWIPDEFFRCLRARKEWYLFDPAICPKLYDSYDEGYSKTYLSDQFINENKEKYLFTYRYRKYIRQNKWEKKISCEELIEEIVETVKESGIPYMLSKDACNRKSNQKNLGVIKSSNLCCEIVIYSDKNETGVCNLSSICINKFIRPYKSTDNPDFKYNISLNENEEFWTFDWEEFSETVRNVQNNIDRLIDLNFYPTECCRRSNLKHRNIGIGIQGEADMMAMLRLPWNGKEANRLRFYIFERMYYESLKASVELSKKNGPYESFSTSPAAKGELQFDLWLSEGRKLPFPLSLDWDTLKDQIQEYGLRNSLFIAPMPTASTSGIMGNSPSIEPFNSLVYIRKNKAGDITMVNKNLVKDLMNLGLWNQTLSDKILQNHGSINEIFEIPKKIRDSYKTAYDLEPKDIIDAAYMRAWFVDQSQSLNLWFDNVTVNSFTKAITRGFQRGLKTLSYYCRTRSATIAQKVQISKVPKEQICYIDDPNCEACGA